MIADLSGASPQSGTPALSPQQRAFLRLTRPLGLLDGTALLAAPSDFAKDAIERILRQPISEALGRHLGVAVNLAVVVDASAASGGSEVPDPSDQRRPAGAGGDGAATPSRTSAAGHRPRRAAPPRDRTAGDRRVAAVRDGDGIGIGHGIDRAIDPGGTPVADGRTGRDVRPHRPAPHPDRARRPG